MSFLSHFQYVKCLENQVPLFAFMTMILLYVYPRRNFVSLNFERARWYLRENKMISDKANNY